MAVSIKNGAFLDQEGVGKVARLALREVFWCKLLGEHGFYVHFGHDYYMYIGYEFAPALPSRFEKLFVEDFPSPYS
ncbi:hypothetical protein [Blastopirellula marina]|nr:hypothetical protein [Blastopirellula marina]